MASPQQVAPSADVVCIDIVVYIIFFNFYYLFLCWSHSRLLMFE